MRGVSAVMPQLLLVRIAPTQGRMARLSNLGSGWALNYRLVALRPTTVYSLRRINLCYRQFSTSHRSLHFLVCSFVVIQ